MPYLLNTTKFWCQINYLTKIKYYRRNGTKIEDYSLDMWLRIIIDALVMWIEGNSTPAM